LFKSSVLALLTKFDNSEYMYIFFVHIFLYLPIFCHSS